MELDEILLRKQHLQQLESREDGPETPQEADLTMDDSEKNRYKEFPIQRKEDRDKVIADRNAFIESLQESIGMLKSMHESDSRKIDEMLAKINDLTAQLKLRNSSRGRWLMVCIGVNGYRAEERHNRSMPGSTDNSWRREGVHSGP